MTPVSLRPSRLLKLSFLCLPIALTACASAPPPPPVVQVVDSGCKAFTYLSWDVDDTVQTATEIRRHNKKYATLCPKKP